MDSSIICLSEFFLVILGYLLSWLYLNASPVSKEEKENRVWISEGLPFFYKWEWIYNIYILYSHNLGVALTGLWKPSIIKKLSGLLKASGIRLSLEAFLTFQLLSSILFPSLLYFWVVFLYCNFKPANIPDGSMLVIALAVIVLGTLLWLYQFWMIREKAIKRQQAIIRTLPFGIDLIGSAMRSGQDFMAAVRFYVNNEEESNPLVQEFSQVMRDMSGGKKREDAMRAMADRVQLESFTTFVSAIIHGENVGASIVQTLKNQGSMLRRERFALAQQRAERAETMMLFPTILILLPALLIVVGFAIFMKASTSLAV